MRKLAEFFVLLVLAVATGTIARNKGYSFIMWTILGMVLPFIALVMILLKHDKTKD